MSRSSSPSELFREDFERVVRKLGRPPSRYEYQSEGEFSPERLLSFVNEDVWEGVVTAFGYEYPCDGYRGPIPSENEVADDFLRVVEKLGHPPLVAEYEEHGRYATRTFVNRVGDGDYNTAVRKLGHKPRHYLSAYKQEISDEELVEDFIQIANSLGRTPTAAEYRETSSHNSQTIAQRFGGGQWKRGVVAIYHLYETYLEN